MQKKREEQPRITVATFIKMLQAYPADHEVYFSGLDFYRLKDRGPYVQVEFNQTVYRDSTSGDVIVENHD